MRTLEFYLCNKFTKKLKTAPKSMWKTWKITAKPGIMVSDSGEVKRGQNEDQLHNKAKVKAMILF